MNLRTLRTALQDGTETARSVIDAALARIEENDATIGAFLETYDAEARLAADELDARRARGEALGPLAGIPIAVKDNILVQGHIASSGSRLLESYRAAYTATAVERLQAAGAIVIGRTNMDEFAQGSSTENSAFGVTKNPHDLERVPGGTSGGSAAAVAAGFVPIALGSDTGGSVRNPASLCGLVGFKPTYGSISRYGLMASVSSFDQIGPLTTCVEDTAELFRLMSGVDPHDATTIPVEASVPELGMMEMHGLRIGVPKQFFNDGLEAGVAERIQEALSTFEQAGATLVSLDIPLLDAALAMYYVINPAEVSSNLNRYDGLQYGEHVPGASLTEQVAATRDALLGTEVKRRILLGTFVLSAGYVDAYYKRAERARAQLKRALAQSFERVDVIVGPTMPTPAWKIGEKYENPLTMYLADIYTVVASMAGLPALSVPCGLSGHLPVGLQVIGPAGADARVLDVGYWWQQARG